MKRATVYFKGGSKFQEEVAMLSLKALLESWEDYYKNAHKKNIIEIKLETTKPIDK